MICPHCVHVFLPRLALEPGLALVRMASGSRPNAVAYVRCPRCLAFCDGATRNTIAHEDCYGKTT